MQVLRQLQIINNSCKFIMKNNIQKEYNKYLQSRLNKCIEDYKEKLEAKKVLLKAIETLNNNKKVNE